jgi:hypothetical protein
VKGRRKKGGGEGERARGRETVRDAVVVMLLI